MVLPMVALLLITTFPAPFITKSLQEVEIVASTPPDIGAQACPYEWLEIKHNRNAGNTELVNLKVNLSLLININK
jgi:hypothetical protein